MKLFSWLTIGFFLLLISPVVAQPYCIELELAFNEEQVASAPTLGNGLIVLTNHGNAYRIDGTGAITWSRNFNGFINPGPVDMIPISNGNFLILGTTGILTEIDPNGNYVGNLLWEKAMNVSEVTFRSLIQTSDGGFLLCGGVNYALNGPMDMYVLKIKGSGSLEWAQAVGGEGHEIANKLLETSSGLFMVSGFTNSFGAGLIDIYTVAFDSSGVLLSTRTFGNALGNNTIGMVETNSGVLIASNNHMIRLNGQGNLVQQISWSDLVAFSFITRNAQLVLSGERGIYPNSNNGVVMLNAQAQVIGTRLFDVQALKDAPYFANVLSSGELVFSATEKEVFPNTDRRFDISKLDGGGTTCCGSSFSFATVQGNFVQGIGGGANTILTQTTAVDSLSVVSIVPLVNDICANPRLAVSPSLELEQELSFKVFPNPANTMVYLEWYSEAEPANLSFWNIQGKIVHQTTINGRAEIDISQWAKGVYLIKISSESKTEEHRLLVE